MNQWIDRLEIFCHRVGGRILRSSSVDASNAPIDFSQSLMDMIAQDDVPALKKALLPSLHEGSWVFHNSVIYKALDEAMRHSAPKCMDWLLLNVDWKTNVHSLASSAAFYGQSQLLAKMFKIDPKVPIRATALHCALQGNQANCAEMTMLALEGKPYEHLAKPPVLRSSANLPQTFENEDGPHVVSTSLLHGHGHIGRRFVNWQITSGTSYDYVKDEMCEILASRVTAPKDINQYLDVCHSWFVKDPNEAMMMLLRGLEFSYQANLVEQMFEQHKDMFCARWDDIATGVLPVPKSFLNDETHELFSFMNAHPVSVPLSNVLNHMSRRSISAMAPKMRLYLNLVGRHANLNPVFEDFLLTPRMGPMLEVLLTLNPSVFRKAIDFVDQYDSNGVWERNIQSSPVLSAWWSQQQLQEALAEREPSSNRARKM